MTTFACRGPRLSVEVQVLDAAVLMGELAADLPGIAYKGALHDRYVVGIKVFGDRDGLACDDAAVLDVLGAHGVMPPVRR